MKVPFVATLVMVSALAAGQIAPAEQPIQRAFETLRNRAGLKLELAGSETVGGITSPFETTVYWWQAIEDDKPVAKVEVVGTRGGLMAFRIVGDGVTLYAWDARRNEYMATRYGNFGQVQPENYVASLLNSLGSIVRGQAALPVRLVAEVYGGSGAMYRTWMPGIEALDDGQAVRYQMGDPVRRRLEFWYTQVPPGVRLDRVAYYDMTRLGASTRELDWGMDVMSFDVALTEANFEFVPPPGARPVVGIRPVS